jgi:LysM domain-containing protein
MKTQDVCLTSVCCSTLILACLIVIRPAYCAFINKNYVIRYDRGWDILCDPYVVKKNDWILKLFRQKGEISHKDYPEFLRIFKRLNPHVHDSDRIRPGEHILIPLKKVRRDALPEQSSGVVTIPFLADSRMSQALEKYSSPYRVQKGDSISILVSRQFEGYGTKAYEQGMKLFRVMNPKIKNLNRIYVGQVIRIPDPKIQSQPWTSSLFEQPTQHGKTADIGPSITEGQKTPIPSMAKDTEKPAESPLSKVAWALDAKFFNKGVYYFPRLGWEDVKVDLSSSPFMELRDGTRVFFPMNAGNQASEIKMAKSFWKDVHIVTTGPGDSVEQIFDAVLDRFENKILKNRLSISDHNVKVEVRGMWVMEYPEPSEEEKRYLCITLLDGQKERTPTSIVRYLDQNNIVVKEVVKGKISAARESNAPRYKRTPEDIRVINALNHKMFVSNFLGAMGYRYQPNETISFEYAGINIDATSNLVTHNSGISFLIDFGEFYGDAIQAIKKSGRNIIQIKDSDTLNAISARLLAAMGVSFTENPHFLVAKRSAGHNITLTIPGFLIDDADTQETLLAMVPLHDGVVEFLADHGIRIMMVKLNDDGIDQIPF